MQPQCSSHSIPLDKVCLQSNCDRKGPLCSMCINSHDKHQIKNLDDFLNEQNEFFKQDYKQYSLQKLDQIKQYFQDSIIKLQVQISSIDQTRTKLIWSQLKNEMKSLSTQQFYSKVTELVQRNQLNEGSYLVETYDKIVIFEQKLKELFEKFPQKKIEQISHPQSQQQSSSILQKSYLSSEVRDQSPELTNRSNISNKSKEPIFKQKQLTPSPIMKRLIQRDLSPVGSFNQSKLKNYFTEQDSQIMQQSARSKQESQSSFKITKPFQIQLDQSSDNQFKESQLKIKNGSQNQSFEFYRNTDSNQKNNNFNQQTSIDIIQKPQMEIKQYISKSPQNQSQSQFNFLNNNNQQNGYFSNQQTSQLQQIQQSNSKQKLQEVKQFNENQEEVNSKKNEENLIFSIQNPLLQKSNQLNISPPSQQQINLSYATQRSIAQVKITENLPNPLQIKHIQTLKRHEKGVMDLIFMDEDKLISCSRDKLISIFTKSGEQQEKMKLQGHEKDVFCLAFRRQPPRMIVSGSVDKTLIIYKPNPTWKQAHVCKGHTDRVRAICILNNLIASGSDDTYLILWNFQGDLMYKYKTNGRITALQQDQETLIIASGKQILLYDVSNRDEEMRVEKHSNIISCLYLELIQHRNGKLYSGGRDNQIIIWEYPQLQILQTFLDDYQITSLYFHPLNYLFVGVGGYEQEGKITIWKIDQTPKKIQEIYKENQYACHKLILEDDRLYSAHENRRIEIYQIQFV